MSADAIAIALTSAEFQAGVERQFWRLAQREGNRVYLECYTWAGDSYVLELQCDRLLDEPCLGRFVDRTTLQCVASAWPQGTAVLAGWLKWTPNELFICWPGDRAGIAHHPDWRVLQHWKKTGNPIVQYLEFIRQCLNLPSRGYLPPQDRKAA